MIGNIDCIKALVVGEVPFHRKLKLPPFTISFEDPESVYVIVPVPDADHPLGKAPVDTEPVNAVALTTILFMVLNENTELFTLRVKVVSVLLVQEVGV